MTAKTELIQTSLEAAGGELYDGGGAGARHRHTDKQLHYVRECILLRSAVFVQS